MSNEMIIIGVTGVVTEPERWEEIETDLQAALASLPAEDRYSSARFTVNEPETSEDTLTTFHGKVCADPRSRFATVERIVGALDAINGVSEITTVDSAWPAGHPQA